MRPRFLALAALALALACDSPTEPHALKCNRMPIYVMGGDTAWVIWSPVQGFPCKR